MGINYKLANVCDPVFHFPCFSLLFAINIKHAKLKKKTLISYHLNIMVTTNRFKRENMRKLRTKASHSKGIVKKTTPATKKFTERKRQLEESFSVINAELISLSQLPHNTIPSGYNVFMEILRVRQVIELDDEEQSQTSQLERIDAEPTEQPKNKRNRTSGETTTKALDEVLVVGEQNNLPSRRFKRSATPKQKSSGEGPPLNEADLTDLDLRVLVDQCPPSSSANSSSVPGHGRDAKLSSPNFISRARFDARAPLIDMNGRYKLNGLRYFQDIAGQDLRGATSSYDIRSLKIVSFNILCQRTMDKMPHIYPHLRRNPTFDQWKQRKRLLLIEFDRLDADVFCLQEVQDVHFEQDLLPFFTSRKYKSLFTARNGTDMPDGCAIFWRSDHLELIKSTDVYYNLGVNGMHKDNVGQVLAFAIAGTQSAICISNTHIYFNMKYGLIKLAQMAYLLCSMHRMESQIRADARQCSHFVGHFLCGDFNMYPATPLHKFIIESSVDLRQNPMEMARFCAPKMQRSPCTWQQLPVHRMRISSKCTFVDDESVDNLLDLKTVSKLTHPFTLASVYEHWNFSGEPEVSTYHNNEAESPDFIFYSVAEQRDIFGTEKSEDKRDKPLAYESFIRLVRRLSMPTSAQLDRACGPLPNAEHGSDHLSLWANFELLVVPR